MRFMEQSRDFDQRLATVLNQAFQDSKNLDSTFKVCVFMKNNMFSRAPAAARVHFFNHPIQKAASDVCILNLSSAAKHFMLIFTS